jgi:hypothetical protein
MKLLLSLLILSLVACSESKDAPPTVTEAPIQDPGPTVPKKLCSESPLCVGQCFTYYPYRSKQDIDQEWADRGLLFSGGHTKALADNQVLFDQYLLCINGEI